jgi:uncharacterized protein
MQKKTLVIGASENPARYSHKAICMLVKYAYNVVAIGNKVGEVSGIQIQLEMIQFDGVDTITIYLGERNQIAYVDYILKLKPNRIIFNPGAENEMLKKLAEAEGIVCMDACTLVLLSTGQY